MPVRKVSNWGGNIIGRFPSLKLGRMVDFESLIERDFLYLLDFDADVTSFVEQPLTIEYAHNGKRLRYTPDFHLIQAGQNMLVECKPAPLVSLPQNQRKFSAAQGWCATQGWTFQVVTDDQLRQGYRLTNVKLLTQFARYEIKPDLKERIRTFLSTASSGTTMAEAMHRVAPERPASVAVPLYHMAFHHELLLPLDEAPLSAASPVRLARRGT